MNHYQLNYSFTLVNENELQNIHIYAHYTFFLLKIIELIQCFFLRQAVIDFANKRFVSLLLSCIIYSQTWIILTCNLSSANLTFSFYYFTLVLLLKIVHGIFYVVHFFSYWSFFGSATVGSNLKGVIHLLFIYICPPYHPGVQCNHNISAFVIAVYLFFPFLIIVHLTSNLHISNQSYLLNLELKLLSNASLSNLFQVYGMFLPYELWNILYIYFLIKNFKKYQFQLSCHVRSCNGIQRDRYGKTVWVICDREWVTDKFPETAT